MKLVQEFTFTGTLKPPVPIGAGPTGTRMYYEASGGEIIGDRLSGKLLGGGDERYAWTNTTFFVGEGRIIPNLGVEYRVWRPE